MKGLRESKNEIATLKGEKIVSVVGESNVTFVTKNYLVEKIGSLTLKIFNKITENTSATSVKIIVTNVTFVTKHFLEKKIGTNT